MIGVDANILVRYAVKDDLEQTAIAMDFLAIAFPDCIKYIYII